MRQARAQIIRGLGFKLIVLDVGLKGEGIFRNRVPYAPNYAVTLVQGLPEETPNRKDCGKGLWKVTWAFLPVGLLVCDQHPTGLYKDI